MLIQILSNQREIFRIHQLQLEQMTGKLLNSNVTLGEL
jgi:hypothetical protein